MHASVNRHEMKTAYVHKLANPSLGYELLPAGILDSRIDSGHYGQDFWLIYIW